MTNTDAVTATVAALVAAIIGVAVAAGLDLSKDLQDHIITLITVATPIVVLVIAWIRHSNAKETAAKTLADSKNNITSASV